MNQSTESETHLVSRAGNGDLGAFRVLVEKHQERAIRIAFRISGDFHAAEDLAQEGFVKAFWSLSEFDPDKGAFSSWLFVIVRNLSLNFRRKKVPLPMDLEEEAICESLDPSSTFDSRDRLRILDKAIEELDEPFRSAFLLAEMEELPLQQVAEIEGAALGTIKSRISRAKATLRSKLQSLQP